MGNVECRIGGAARVTGAAEKVRVPGVKAHSLTLVATECVLFLESVDFHSLALAATFEDMECGASAGQMRAGALGHVLTNAATFEPLRREEGYFTMAW
jgi:hypothetical protein